MALLRKLSQLNDSKIFRYGLPFILFVVGGSFGLKEFAQLRYDYSKRDKIDPEEMNRKYGIKMKKKGEVTLESEYEKMKQPLEVLLHGMLNVTDEILMDIDNWTNVRISRPWENSLDEDK